MAQGGVLVRSMAWPDGAALDEADPAESVQSLRAEPCVAPEPTDAELVRRALAGDRRAEEAIFLRHSHMVTAMALRMLGDRSEAEDVTQDTFLTVLGELSCLRDPSSVGGWIRRVAIRKVHRRFRRRRMLRALGLSHRKRDLPLDSLANTDLQPDMRAELAKLSEALERLPARLRVVWLLRRVEGYTLRETAEACDCSSATVKRRYAEACTRLSEHVDFAPTEDDDG